MQKQDPLHIDEILIPTAVADKREPFSEKEKIAQIKYHFREIMKVLGLDLNDDSLRGTPERVAKMYVNEYFSGLNPENKPEISLFDNTYDYHHMVIEKDITFYSNCEHHFVPIIGKVHVAYIPGEKVIGLSKINRLVQYYARRPQVQERLTQQIAEELKTVLQHKNVAVMVDAEHLCVTSRGIKDINSQTRTVHFSGEFEKERLQVRFLSSVDTKN